MIPNQIDPGGEDDFDPTKAEDPDATALPDPKIAKIEAEHDELIGDLGAIEEPPSATRPMAAEHDELIGELADIESGPPEPDLLERISEVVDQPEAAAQPTKQSQRTGRYYVPPKQRTPQNREQRRAEHDRSLDEKGRDIEAFHAGELPVINDEGERGEFPSEDALRNLMDSDVRNRDSIAQLLIDHARRLDEITEKLERQRL